MKSQRATIVLVLRWMLDIGLLLLAIFALAIPLQLDRWKLGVFLTYGPRPLIAITSLPLLVIATLLRSKLRVLISIASILCCLSSIDRGQPGKLARPSQASDLKIVSFNIHGQSKALFDYLEATGLQPDILCVQEVQFQQKRRLIELLPEYHFFAAQRLPNQRGGKYFPSCLTGLRKERFQADAKIHSAITNYRTFAITTTDRQTQRKLSVINAHTTKALALHGPRAFFTKTPAKAFRHAEERQMIEDWIASRDEPTVLAGDFNAPSGSMGVRIQGTTNAHSIAGRGLLLTFPAKLPIVGIDHILGNADIEFLRSHILSNKFSDHCGRYAEFRMRSNQTPLAR